MSCGLSSSQLIEARRRRCPSGAAARHCTDSATKWCLARSLELDGLVLSFNASIYTGCLFYGCISYADDTILLSGSCYRLQKLLDVCSNYGTEWDIKFNPCRQERYLYLWCMEAEPVNWECSIF